MFFNQVQIVVANCGGAASIWNRQELDHFAAGMTPGAINIYANRAHLQRFEIELFMAIKMNVIVNPSICKMATLFGLPTTTRKTSLCSIWIKVSHNTTNSIPDNSQLVPEG
jgi:hypothetical protein